ncbi:MAG: 4Fe-4S dicluster domain-containing protein [Coriobacteriales bacterium]|jgi:NADH dehydrogenase/NADH:ubiquinone oxidoreductase subunit G|nr:4Fe-4S dicluster domain-containing protein [Coriobacteriales bacterium]
MRIIIDGVTCEAQPDEFVKTVADRSGITIPSLCHHSALPGIAACRLCVVEATPAGGKTQTVTSCVYPVSEGLEISTASEPIKRLRRIILKLLLERAPAAEGRLQQYCEEYGVHRSSTPANPEEKCILCGLCVKACEEMGNAAIATVKRGVDKQIQPAFEEAPEDCIGCLSCAKVCPTGEITWLETHESRTIWKKDFSLERCSVCGKPFATAEELAWLQSKQVGENIEVGMCPGCRAREAVAHTLLDR